MPKQIFVPDVDLTAIAIGYKNAKENLIADKVSPYRNVLKRDFSFNKYPIEQMFTVPETKVGRTSRVNRIEFSAERAASFVEDYGLDVPVPGYDQDNAPKNYDPKGRAVEGATNLILLDREIRVAELFRNPANYAYKQTLSAGSYIDDPNSHPVELILEAKKDMIAGADSLVLGMDVWTKLRLHPRVVAACQGNSGTSGVASR